MADTNGQTLADAIQLLSKVSDKLADKTLAKEKKTTVEKITNTPTKTDNSKNNTKNIEQLLANMGSKKEDTVVEKPKDVIISSFGRQADDELVSAFGKGNKEKKEQEKKEKSGGFLDALLGPGLLILGAIAGLIASLMEGGWGNIIKDFAGGNYKDAFAKLQNKVVDIVLKNIGPSTPIIGPFFALYDAYKAFNEGDLPMGLNFLLQALLGMAPIPAPVKLILFNGMNIITELLEPKDKQGNRIDTIPRGAGSSIMAFILKAIGKVFTFGFLKKLPIIGALFNLYDAYISFKTGTPAGIAKGIIDIVSAIASFVPGYGTLISLGLDVLTAFLFSTEDVKDKNGTVTGQTVSIRGWAIKLWNWLKPKLKFIPIISTVMYAADAYKNFSKGDWVAGIISLEEMLFTTIPGGGGIAVASGVEVLKQMFLAKENKKNEKGNLNMTALVTNFAKELKNKMLNWIVNQIPDLKWMGKYNPRSYIGKMLGVNIVTENTSIFDNLNQTSNKVDIDKAKTEMQKNASTENNTIKTDDFIQTPDGKIIQPANSDTTIGFKPGGALDNYFSKNFELTSDNNSLLKNLTKMQNDLLQKQIDILQSSNRYLAEMRDKSNKPNNVISAPKITTNNYGGLGSLRTLQGVT